MSLGLSDTILGETLGEYTILRQLAVGGMAEIYLAESTQIHGFRKKVVIKRILPQFANDPLYVNMFFDEARLVARLNHPSIAQVFDIGQTDGCIFFTMEYIEGHDLSALLRTCDEQKRRLTLEEVMAIVVPMAEGLHYAHELRDEYGELMGLVHRDVSPSNVIITREGRVKLLDFGVAKSKSHQRMTTGVSLMGKFGYLSPEQCQGIKLDRRSDIFSYGTVLWELLTGRQLFPGGNKIPVLERVMNEDTPDPSTRRSDVPPRIDLICRRALARDRDLRYASLDEILTDLDEYKRHTRTITTSRTLEQLLKSVFPNTANSIVNCTDLASHLPTFRARYGNNDATNIIKKQIPGDFDRTEPRNWSSVIVEATLPPVPIKNEPAQNEPAQNEPAQNEPAQNEPAQNEPAQNEPAHAIGFYVNWARHKRLSAKFIVTGLLLLLFTVGYIAIRTKPRREPSPPPGGIETAKTTTQSSSR